LRVFFSGANQARIRLCSSRNVTCVSGADPPGDQEPEQVAELLLSDLGER